MMNELIKNNRREFWILGFILAVGVMLRFLLLDTYYFMPENHSLYDFIVIKNIILNGDLSAAGRISSVEGFRYSPFYHYLILPVFYLFDDEFTGMMFFTLLLNLASLLVYFYIAKRSLRKLYCLLFCLLLVFSVYEITELLTLWALNCIPFFASITLLSLFKIIIDDDKRWFFVLGAALSSIIQIHAMGYVFMLYAVFIFWRNQTKISQGWLCVALWIFAFLMIPNILQQTTMFERKYYFFMKAVFDIFSLGKYKDFLSHTPMEYFNAFFYFFGLVVVLRKSSDNAFFSDDIAKFFRALSWAALAFIIIYGGDIFHIYIYRGFTLAVFAGIAIFIGRYKKMAFIIFGIYVFLISLMILSVSFVGSDYFVDFRNRKKTAAFLNSENAAMNRVYNISHSYKEEIVAGWYKHFMGGQVSKGSSESDIKWVIAEGDTRRAMLMENIQSSPFCSFGNIYIFKLDAEKFLNLEEKMDFEDEIYLYALTDFDYSMEEIEHLWKY